MEQLQFSFGELYGLCFCQFATIPATHTLPSHNDHCSEHHDNKHYCAYDYRCCYCGHSCYSYSHSSLSCYSSLSSLYDSHSIGYSHHFHYWNSYCHCFDYNKDCDNSRDCSHIVSFFFCSSLSLSLSLNIYEIICMECMHKGGKYCFCDNAF